MKSGRARRDEPEAGGLEGTKPARYYPTDPPEDPPEDVL
jgi:hypothetical protein